MATAFPLVHSAEVNSWETGFPRYGFLNIFSYSHVLKTRILYYRDPRGWIMQGGVHDFMFASGGGLSEGYGRDGPGVCLGDGQTEAEGVPRQGGRGDALLRRMSTYAGDPT